ncbi:hypothetical protein [Streptomyces zhihengii]|uniref:Uncharacterized protein n=1 Tax=Streptomyces zhihengii TaxID=1818004 RepID=A0ABS2V1A6_9ACTN|nr:hypothetical protein [Streptomyces zhihengii]MBM9623611.1 hypothetical protein [Streptomyces zhihengii]
MSQQPKSSGSSHGEGPSRHGGAQHGWSPDVDETRRQDNPSAHRSFHPERHAPGKGPGRKVSEEETEDVPGDTVPSTGARGERRGPRSGEEGMHSAGRRGRSQRPSGTKDASATTGVDPQDPPGTRSGG